MRDRNWPIVFVYSIIMCIAMALPIFGGSVVNTAMARELGWDSTALGLLVVSNMVSTALLLPFAAKASQKFGVRASMIFGFVAMGAGATALSSIVSGSEQAILAYGVAMAITSAFSGVVPCQTGVALWFPTRRTLAFSLLYAITGVATFGFISLISNGIAQTGDWRTGWHIFVVAAAVGLLLAFLFVRDPKQTAGSEGESPRPAEMGPQPDGTAAVYPGKSFAQAVRMPLFAVIGLSMIIITAGSIFLAAHAQVFLLARGYSVTEAASSMSVMQIGMVIGNLGLGFLAPRIQLRRAMALALVAYALAFALLANVAGTGWLLAFAIAAGIGYGAGQVGSMALMGHYWDQKVFPMLTAAGLMMQTVGSAIVPVLAGGYYDKYGSYLPPIYTMMAVNLLIAVAILIAGREPRRDPVAAI
jgi:MFS family permease